MSRLIRPAAAPAAGLLATLSASGARAVACAACTLVASMACLLVAAVAAAQPSPLDGGLFAFPSYRPSPASARSAALALADDWLGDEPFDNPAAGGAVVAASPLLQRLSRQDLRARFRDYDETPAFFDAAGGFTAWPVARSWQLGGYATQPEVRREESSFTRGESGGPLVPATVQTTTAERETRVGVAFAWRSHALAIGVAPEWTHRTHRYEQSEQSGDPGSGTTTLEFSGSGVGVQIGATASLLGDSSAGLRVGAGARYLPRLDLSGTHREDVVVGFSESAIDVSRR